MKYTRRTLLRRSASAGAAVSLAGIAVACTTTTTPGAATAAGARQITPVRVMTIVFGEPPPPRDQNPFWKELEKRIGARLDIEFVPNSAYDEKLAVVLASGDLPDIVYLPSYSQVVAQAITQGAFMSWDDLLDKDLTFTAKAKYPGLAETPSRTWRNGAYNGRIFAHPRPRPQAGQEIFVRKDWLDKLGLAVPKTTTEMLAAWKAITERDPDGNGQKDTTGYVMSKPIGGFDFFLNAFAVPNGYTAKADGSLTPALLSPAYKDAVGFARDAFAAGVLDRDFQIITGDQRDQKIQSGKGGGFFEAVTGYFGRYNRLRKANKDATLFGMSPPSAPGVTAHVYNNRGWTGLIAVSAKPAKDAARREDLLHVLDFWADPGNDRFLNYGIEGEHYTLDAEGFPEKKQGVPDYTNAIKNGLGNSYFHYWDAGTKWQNALIKELTDRVEAIGVDDPTWGLVSDTFRRSGKQLEDFHATNIANFITGKAPLSDWDKFVADWRKKGGDEITADLAKLYLERKKRGG